MSRMSRPEMPQGYLGAQSKFREWGLSAISHNNPEITADDKVEIKLKTTMPMKVTSNLINGSTDQEYKDLVFTQTEDGTVSLIVLLPAAGYFKLQIYALLASDDSKTLPNVYNYLIHSPGGPRCPPPPFPKQYAQWKEGCFLHEPLNLTSLNNLDNVAFRVKIPGAKAVALTVDGEWFHLQKEGGEVWQGQVKGLARYKGKGLKASLNANYGPDETKYSSLLEYEV